MSREQRVWIAVTIVLSGFVASVAFHYHLGFHRNLGYPQTTFLFKPDDAAMDYYNILDATRGLDPYASPLAVYFPFTYVPFLLLLPLPGVVGYLAVVALFTAVTLHFVGRQLAFLPHVSRRAATLALTLPTYPYLFSIDRGNVEMLVFVFLCFFFLAFEAEKGKLAAFWLACATAMKLYPGVFAVLFLRRKMYREFAASVIFTLLLSAGSMFLYEGGPARVLAGLQKNLVHFRDVYVLGYPGLPFNSSWFGVLRIAILEFAPELAPRMLSLILPYTALCVTLFAAISLVVVRREIAFWQQVMLLGFPMLLFPEVSFDYKLIHTMFPVAFFLRAHEGGKRGTVITVLLSALLVPKAYFWFYESEINIGVIANPLLMSLLMGLALVSKPRTDARRDGRSQTLQHSASGE